MEFRDGETQNFERIFNAKKKDIAAMSGCQSVRLLGDINTPNIYMTYSIWENTDALENYRKSDLFKEVWSQTKMLFAAPAQAWSLEQK
jgi:heme-degrading monooxygenase HmoA